jgi:hypothetical protein
LAGLAPLWRGLPQHGRGRASTPGRPDTRAGCSRAGVDHFRSAARGPKWRKRPSPLTNLGDLCAAGAGLGARIFAWPCVLQVGNRGRPTRRKRFRGRETRLCENRSVGSPPCERLFGARRWRGHCAGARASLAASRRCSGLGQGVSRRALRAGAVAGARRGGHAKRGPWGPPFFHGVC